MSPPLLHADGLKRCPWPKQDPLYVAYHDEEWGVPEYDDRALYEKLILDGFQAGLSWITILRKRENFRRAFDGFEPEKIARYTPKKIEKLMQDAGIVRNRMKIDGAVLSARAYLDAMEKGRASRGSYGSSSAGGPRSTVSARPRRSRRRRRCRARCLRSWRGAASSSSGPASSMPSCRRPEWSTTTW